MPQDRPGPDPGPNPGPFDDLFERLIGNLESTLGDTLGGATGRRPSTGGRTPKLDRFGRDLTAEASRGELDPVIGRDAEIDQVLEVLARRTKNNPVLVGDPGVGKTAIAEGIAQRVADGTVPEVLRGVRVVALDLVGMVAGTRYRGDFEQRLTGVIDEVVAAERSVVLFLDELHVVIGAGSAEGAPMDAASMLKPALARGDLQLIGATTVKEYRRHIEKDAALERRFEPVPVAEPTVETTIAILRGLRPRYEQHHGVQISDAALVAAAEMSDRYVPDRFLPDKAIDLLDRASSRARIRAGGPAASPVDRAGAEELEQLRRAREVAVDAEDFERAHLLTREIEAAEAALGTPGPDLRKDGGPVEIGPDDVARIVSDSTGIPIAQLTGAERRRLLDLEALLHRRVVGQDEAVETVADAVRAGRAGLAHPDRPIGSFLFLGPTGVGKTELARALAEALFGSVDALLRFDMSEYADRSSAFRLVGAPPGHVGYDDAGQLTEAVRRTRYAVLLLDEIEKANAEVVNTLLQVLDAGRLTDSHGRTVDFTHTVVIMTSNLGADRLLTAAGRPVEEVREGVLAMARLHFRPEFLNRVDDIVLFSALDRDELRRITELLLAGTADRLRAQGIELEATPAAIDWLAERGHQPELGARPLRRTIAREVDRVLSRLIIGGELGPGGRVVADVAGGALELRPRTG
ncbi:ATP-dependent Clp protease ATP-binding subunit ClpC [Pseudonocardia hierapolitana]|uniref:ATP-dependent Clp protease ATP-binding subunit ClpC n=1 Tax=Pseudonocardia hierapolitana TaxID=1128676 RepID=A0A561T3S7_9PSEU|nr:ATP-dependent Clp protease ATP-binding subunit [Pseudonocardia hierapolitana]TWF81757.1 ATP-dependent Clp protease ATP-binding subunit ClpC [Pseudonocardia hierapolitana]